MDSNVQELFNAAYQVLVWLIPILVPVIVVRAVIWGKMRWEEIKIADPTNITDFIERAAEFAVRVAEQLADAGLIDVEARKAEALRAIVNFVEQHGYQINIELLEDAIEEAIRRLKERPEW